MEMNRHHFEDFILENFEHYIRRKREPHTHGNNVEIQGQFFRLYLGGIRWKIELFTGGSWVSRSSGDRF